jgi:uncharacterized membrane protein YjjP (DUF1212 family)
MDIGEAMILAGGDVNTVEQLTRHMGIAYGAAKMNVLVITASIIVTVTLEDGDEYTQTRRIEEAASIDFTKLEKLTRLCVKCINAPMQPRELQRRLIVIKSLKFPRPLFYVSGVLSCAGFAVFFGGSWLDALMSAIFSVLVVAMMIHLRPLTPNTVVFNFLASLISGLAICLVELALPQMSVGMVTVGIIMLLIPGVAMTSSIRDMISGDTVSGSLRLIESLLWAGALAIGFMTAMWFFRMNAQDVAGMADPIIALVASAVGSLGFALFFNVRRGLLEVCTIGGVLCYAVYLLCSDVAQMEGVFIPTLLASVFAAVYSEALSRRTHAPTSVFFIVSVIPLVPGRGLYYTMLGVVQQNVASISSFGSSTIQTALGIAIGLVIVWAFVQTARNIQRKHDEKKL